MSCKWGLATGVRFISRDAAITGQRVLRVGTIINTCENAYKILVGIPQGKRPLGRPGCRWEDNIRMDLRKIGWEHLDWIHLA